ncbi:hypothetical protein GJ496_003110 [Pomphorhynchus laevis]|nr:hypothetical protein GJ496_003110 [Pomphorhynchus laevis]
MCQAHDSSEDSDSLATRLQTASEKIRRMRQLDLKEVFQAISEECDPDRKIALEHATVKGASSWLNILPSEYYDFSPIPSDCIAPFLRKRGARKHAEAERAISMDIFLLIRVSVSAYSAFVRREIAPERVFSNLIA